MLNSIARGALLAPVLVSLCLAAPEREQISAQDGWLVLGSTDARARQPFNPDAAFARYLLDRGRTPPVVGEEVTGTDGSSSWSAATPDENGRIGGGVVYAYRALESETDRVVYVRLLSAATLWVNGDARYGNIYGQDFGGVPVKLNAGTNHVFVRGVRGALDMTMEDVDAPAMASGRDTTRPDLVAGIPNEGMLAVAVTNCTERWLDVVQSSSGGDEGAFRRVALPQSLKIPPLGVLKVPVPLATRGDTRSEVGKISVAVQIACRYSDPTDGDEPVPVVEADVELDVRDPDGPRRITFRSAMDGSVQEYSVRPPVDGAAGQHNGVVLSLHGAGVNSFGQARAYSTKDDLWIVAATNRRPFGFDWQDWGRVDAYEVLEHALSWTGADRSRVYLTGHSMGGHGTWNVAANDPDGFAAIAPSAGWPSFDTYVGRPPITRVEPWRGADLESDTLALVDNLAPIPTFVLHGTDDDNVPLGQAEQMIAALEAVGGQPESHFEPGKGHWWNGEAADGADCVDWPGIFELFAKHRIADAPKRIAFTSVHPGVDSQHHWVETLQPATYGRPMTVDARWSPTLNTIWMRTSNVATLRITSPDGDPIERIIIDGFRVEPGTAEVVIRKGSRWTIGDAPAADEKRPGLDGPFKRGLRNGFVFVVGTAGTEAENAELLARARYDTDNWRYRGNGLTDIVRDVDFAFAATSRYAGRNVVLYGNADTNAAWDLVFDDDCPVRAERGALTIGRETWSRDDLSMIFVQRRRDDPGALAAAFADTGPRGTRISHVLLTFVSGVGYPDFTAFTPDVLTSGVEGVLDAGWFGADWQIQEDGRNR